MRKLNRILALLFVFALMLSMTVFAADEGTFNASVTLDYSQENQITVTVPEANDTVLKNQKPTLTIKCDFEKAYVKLDDEVVDAAPELAEGYITFTVAQAGTYVVISGEAPIVVIPTPTPTPVVTPTPTPTPAVTPTPTPTPVVTPSPTPNPNATGGDVKTGDDSNAALWGGITLGSAAAFITTLVVVRKKAEEN